MSPCSSYFLEDTFKATGTLESGVPLTLAHTANLLSSDIHIIVPQTLLSSYICQALW